MDVKEIPRQTQKNVDLKVIKESICNSMTNFYGRDDLSWIDCLFDYELKDSLDVKKGMVHHSHSRGPDEVGELLNMNGVYGAYGDPKAILYTKKLPKGFNLFIVGPEYNNKNLEIICSSPKMDIRDFEEENVIEEINSKVEKLIGGKHKNVKGKINLVGPPINQLEGVTLYKTWEMLVEPSFLFREDIEDIRIFTQIYNNFFNYQEKRDKSFKNTAEKIVKEVLDRKKAGKFLLYKDYNLSHKSLLSRVFYFNNEFSFSF